MSVYRVNHVKDKYQGRIDNYAMDLAYQAKLLLVDLKYSNDNYDHEQAIELHNLCDKLQDVLFFKEEK
jgi:hypothetical protein